MIRNALRWIVVALVAASMLIVAAIVLNRLALNVQSAQPATLDVQVPASNMLLPVASPAADASASVREAPARRRPAQASSTTGSAAA